MAVFRDYMAGVCADVAVRLDQLRSNPPAWATAGQLTDLAVAYRTRADENRGEAIRQRARARLAGTEEVSA